MITIIFLTGFQGGGQPITLQLLIVILKVVVLVGWVMVLSNYVFPKIIHKISDSQEALFLFSLAWVFALTALVSSKYVGFSLEIGGFLAGLALANASENFQIVAKMRALRDFFITIFFVMLGLEVSFANITSVIVPVLVISLFVIVVKPFLITLITGMLGFKKRTAVFVGLSMGQVSEFSLIILFLGSTLNIVPASVITIMVLATIITFVTSAYSINKNNAIYMKIHRHLKFLEKRVSHRENTFGNEDVEKLDNHVVVVGADQLGRSVIHALEKSDEKVIAVDFNPDIVTKCKQKGIPVIFGDISDPDIQQRVFMDDAKMILSTIPDLEDNLILIEGVKQKNKKASIIAMAYEAAHAKALYKAGADYVILPHLAGGRHLAKILLDKNHVKLIEDYKSRDLSDLI